MRSVAAHALFTALGARHRFQVASFQGGGKHNAIPRRPDVVLYGPGRERRLRRWCRRRCAASGRALRCGRRAWRCARPPTSDSARVLQPPTVERLLRSLVSLPWGAGHEPRHSRSRRDVSNLAVVDAHERRGAHRHQQPEQRGAVTGRGAGPDPRPGDLAGADSRADQRLPGLEAQPGLPVLGRGAAGVRRGFGRAPHGDARSTPAWSAASWEKVPGMDMVPFGPQLEGVHSPTSACTSPRWAASGTPSAASWRSWRGRGSGISCFLLSSIFKGKKKGNKVPDPRSYNSDGAFGVAQLGA